MYINLSTIKNHLNIDEAFTGDDVYLTKLEEVAEKVVERNIDTPLSNLEDGEGAIPSPLTQAMLLLIANFYANRESVAFANSTNVPYSYQYLIDLYRNYRGESKEVQSPQVQSSEENIDENNTVNQDEQ